MNLIKSDNPILVTKSTEVSEADIDSVRGKYVEMTGLMYKLHGLGLAANQIGETKRYFVWDYGMVINPEILMYEGKIIENREGCLSYPGIIKDVKRNNKITVTYLDERGIKMNKVLVGVPAMIFQHEFDHLEGITLINKDDKPKES